MKIALLAGALALAALPAVGKEKIVPLSAADAAALKDKTVAVTFHETPTFMGMTAGKASFAMLGAFAMAAAGNELVRENEIADPGVVLREQLAIALRDVYGAKPQPADTIATKAKKPAQIAATHPDADYVLDVRSLGWGYAYLPKDWTKYYVSYSARVQLVDKAGREIASSPCTATSFANKSPPTREQLHDNGALSLKDYTHALGWVCVQFLGLTSFQIPADKLAVAPEPYAELMGRFAPESVNPAPVLAAGPETTAQAPTAAPAASTTTPAAAAPALEPAVAPGRSDTAPAPVASPTPAKVEG